MILSAGLAPTMSEAERLRISEFIEAEFGIKMPAQKKSLLEGRLSKRVVACGLTSYAEYFFYVTRDPRGQDEFLRFADLVSTHETSFFREPGHFDYLARQALPRFLEVQEGRSLDVLSAACSTGEEAYTLAMVLRDGFRGAGSPDRFLVEGVDLSDRAVGIARRGVYLEERSRTIPEELKKRGLMRSKNRKDQLVRVVPELRAKTRFHTGNLLGDLALGQSTYHIIFCRNVLIYFEPATQKKVLSLLLGRLKPQGLLFLGHSETMISLSMPMRPVAHAVYQRV